MSAVPIVSAEGLGKRYIIRHEQQQPYVALRDVLTDGVRRLGRNLLHPSKFFSARSTREEFWALKDLSFEVDEGARVGIIGRNGAGKSTLLKLLSRVTEPSTGRITLRGRVASLLEVGTGFHPELTGRENIVLNGVILGMTRAEIRKRFDDIVDFAEIETFLDTPVKRYSSGMYMRLAFAVAAHLESEILIVDEVLAVGDAAFQQKCLGKMQEAGNEGRTVLFVSHNMGAIAQFCNTAILLERGRIAARGDVQHVIGAYFNRTTSMEVNGSDFIGPLTSSIHFRELLINNLPFGSEISPADEIVFTVRGHCERLVPKFRASIAVYREGIRLATLHESREPRTLEEGPFEIKIEVPPFQMRPGTYSLALGGHDGGVFGSGTEWLFSHPLGSFSIREEWGSENDYAGTGLVNLRHAGTRIAGSQSPPRYRSGVPE